MTAPIILPCPSQMGAADSWIAISWPERVTSTDVSPAAFRTALAASQGSQQRVFQWLVLLLRDEVQRLADRTAACLIGVPAGEVLGNPVYVVDAAVGVRA